MTREEILAVAKPILFNTDMVRAILDGRKTVTRRLIKFPINRYTHNIPKTDNVSFMELCSDKVNFHEEPFYGFDVKMQYKAGDILYIRETWQYLYKLDKNEQIIKDTGKYYYAATDTLPFDIYVDSRGITSEKIPWRPSIHMPKEATRIFLKVKDVRVERLQDMRSEDALDEGIRVSKFDLPHTSVLNQFKKLWNSTIKKSNIDQYGWDANPWVWVIEFERIDAE